MLKGLLKLIASVLVMLGFSSKATLIKKKKIKNIDKKLKGIKEDKKIVDKKLKDIKKKQITSKKSTKKKIIQDGKEAEKFLKDFIKKK